MLTNLWQSALQLYARSPLTAILVVVALVMAVLVAIKWTRKLFTRRRQPLFVQNRPPRPVVRPSAPVVAAASVPVAPEAVPPVPSAVAANSVLDDAAPLVAPASVPEPVVPPAPAPSWNPVVPAAEFARPRSEVPPTYRVHGAAAANNRLPRVEPADTPLAGDDDYVFGGATPLLASLLPESDARRADIKKELASAGFYQPHAVQNLAAIRYILIMGPLLLMFVALVFVPRFAEIPVLLGLLFIAVMGWAIPRLYVRGQAAERQREIERSMPDVLDMLNMCVSQGMTILPAMTRVNRELRDVYPALSQELGIVVEHARISSLEQALRAFAERVDVPEVTSLTNLLIQTERMGTSITQALGDYAQNMREMLRQRADEKANQATFKLLFPTVLCLMPAVYIFLLGPSILQLSDFFGGGNRPVTEASRTLNEFNNRNPTQQDLF